MQKLRHASLDNNVFYVYIKFGICRSSIKRDIHVPLGTAIVRIWGAEPGLASVREDATRKSVAE